MRIGATAPESSRTTIHRMVMPSVTVAEFNMDFDMSYSAAPLGMVAVCLVHEGSIQSRTLGDVADVVGPGDLVSLAPPDLPSAGRVHSARYNFTMLHPDLLTQVAATAEGRKPQPVRVTGHRPHSATAARQLQNALYYLRDQVLAEPTVADQPLIVSAAGQLLAASVLSAFPNTACTDPTASDRNDAHPYTLRRALAYMDENADSPLTLADIAAAAHVTIRSLQYAFRQHLDTTPLAHLRRLRLSRAHDELLVADPFSGTTVMDIATRWGFFHMGRFAALYRETYGRSPRQTLTDTTTSRSRRPGRARQEG
ncbi:helix-turn-helix transcriptional regulator [Streptomyces sp. NPDC007205]|uniref:helix-turn-helix transcriptional regulator n=1 Tax=Streptomyces sp. NPDC007205 TaxID=3154316 RepID=UPI003405D1A4